MQNHWLILWIERRFQQGGDANSELHGVQQVIGKLYRWFDGSPLAIVSAFS